MSRPVALLIVLPDGGGGGHPGILEVFEKPSISGKRPKLLEIHGDQ